MTATRAQIVEEARTWLGVPWVHQGFSKVQGCDCVGFIRGVGSLVGALHPEKHDSRVVHYEGYARDPNPRVMNTALNEFLVSTPKDKVYIGDVLWIRIAGNPRHLGIASEPGVIIHSDSVTGKVIEHGILMSRVSFIIAAFSFPDVEEQSSVC